MASPSSELLRAVREAEDIAQKAGQPLTTAHLLLALFTFPNRAQLLLTERRIDEDAILNEMDSLPEEPRDAFKRLKDRAIELARGAGADEADSLHLLVALLRVRESLAYELLERTGISLTALRNVVVSYVTNQLPRRFRQMDVPAPVSEVQIAPRPRPAPVVVVETVAPAKPSYEMAEDAEPAAQGAFELDAREYPLLREIGRNLCAEAADGRLDDLIGRQRELSSMVDVLGRRRANNPVLVGPPGVGKTAIVEGLALQIVRNEVAHLKGKVIVEVPVSAMLSGTSLRGALSEKLGQLQHEVKKAQGRVIVFIDELHMLIGAGGSGEGAQDIGNELKAALARGEFPCIGATTDAEYKKYIEQDPAIERRFTSVEVKEPSVDDAVLMLEGGIVPYAEHHGVTYTVDALQAACAWSHKFVPDRRLPDKAFSIVDLAGSRARRHGRPVVGKHDIAEIITEMSGVPRERLEEGDRDRLGRLESILGEALIGQPDAVSRVASALRRGFAGFNRQRPVASMLFLGPTGVGKTELAKVVAEFLFGRKDALVRIDATEYGEAHSISRLVGAPPGYVGHGEGGILTEAVRKRPFQVILFDEFEKAHPEVRNLLLQILDDGRLTDSRGRTVRFVDTVIILTSNAGCGVLHKRESRIGFEGASAGSPERMREDVLHEAKLSFTPELWNRVDEKTVFLPLQAQDLERVAKLILDDVSQMAFAEREVSLTFSTAAAALLAKLGYDPTLGARPLRQTIQRLVESPLADKIVRGELKSGDSIHLDVVNGELTLIPAAPRRAFA